MNIKHVDKRTKQLSILKIYFFIIQKKVKTVFLAKCSIWIIISSLFIFLKEKNLCCVMIMIIESFIYFKYKKKTNKSFFLLFYNVFHFKIL